MGQYDPSENTVEDVLEKLDRVGDRERDRILSEELAGKKRKTILEAYGLDSSDRYDASGRQLYPWEVTGDQMADANRQVEETDEQREAREAQLAQDEAVAATPQGAADPVGTGVAPAADNAPAPDAL